MNDFTAGFCLCVAAVAFIIRSLLLKPSNMGWPPAPTYVRVSMFLLGAAVAYRGMELVGASVWPAAPPQARYGVPFSSVLVCVAMLNYSVAMTVNVARQYYPKAVWRAVERVMTLAQCKQASVLIELSRRGVYVMFPNRKGDPEPISEHDIVSDESVYLSKD